MNNKYKNIILIGYMGTGKTTIGNYIGLTYNMKAIDIDTIIEDTEGRSIKDIFFYKGEEYFRGQETAVLKSLRQESNLVLSCGGGIILKDENISYLKKYGKVILLKSTPETIYNRIKNSDKRPILNNNMDVDFIKNMMQKRLSSYMKAADIIVCNENKSIDALAKEIIFKVMN